MTVTVLSSGGRTAASPVSMIERMTLILDAFDATTPTLTLLELVERTGLPRSTVHRILDQMIRLRWLAHTSGGYRLGMRTLELGGLTADHNEIREAVSPLLHELAQRTGLVGHLAVLDGRDVIYLDKVGGRFGATLPTRLGGRMPAHATALGKAMLAALDPAIAEAAVRGKLTRLTPRTLCDTDALQRELGQIRLRQGVAIDREEAVTGIACVAAPLRGRGMPPAALSLSGRAESMGFDRLARVVLEVAHEAARTLFPRRVRWH
ncbi:IclR family transcriptional regulator [Nocardia terpenica]|uniref:IclR family transcriptional regulator n=1 Tax=Nocardia terpenica TaxID=455432 RepID=A0A164L3Z8_9NOCA|nr:IclR family transcriptional regulator [Nocardia terpenica]KZM71997.1 IclR family transcriptional regulator [Nocardia terpenica]MBF6065843.1 IclR family transcriptional regulator [Nocardia terpenica]MBF6108394.1 IclR family transcriptional regulator [Nocardia terpenica]MBF6115958.1 IclR family transcriptional regulator [Nocardia terpenica]MBF6123088.1 IclR family transcriptional regulator [Nocardia terpenica]